jgi:hypothetical protein
VCACFAKRGSLSELHSTAAQFEGLMAGGVQAAKDAAQALPDIEAQHRIDHLNRVRAPPSFVSLSVCLFDQDLRLPGRDGSGCLRPLSWHIDGQDDGGVPGAARQGQRQRQQAARQGQRIFLLT